MRKTAFVVAIAGLTSPLAVAQSNVTIYGRMNLDFESVQLDDATTASGRTNRISSNSSHFGFRGREDLGGGLSALFQVENQFAADTGGGELASRNTFVGLTGNFGTVRLGLMDTPFKDLGAFTNRYYGTGIQDAGSIAVLGGGNHGFNRRQKNSIRYDTPSWSGVSGSLQYGIENEAPKSDPARTTVWSGSLQYANGPLALAAAYERHSNFTPGNHDHGYRLAAKYDFGPVNLGAEANRLDYDTAGSVRRNYYALSAGIKTGENGLVSLRYGRAGKVSGSSPEGTTVAGGDGVRLYRGAGSGARQITVGYEHNLSKRTQLYTYYTRIDNDANANYRFGVNALNVAAAGGGADPSGFVVGMTHGF